MVLIVCLFTACDSKQSTSTKPTLTVTLEPLRYFTETIAGDKFKIVSMVPKGSSSETYDPTPQQLVNLDKSTAYLRIGYIVQSTGKFDSAFVLAGTIAALGALLVLFVIKTPRVTMKASQA